ncbi:MAG: methyltransferase domain-containing protein [Ignavibacteria bacterium]|nr:methyltransferase domain-containing protein [Ignavibacteria bacterium]
MNLINTYKSLCTEFYDLDKPDAPEDAFSYYLNEAANSVKPVLEPMCGSGRFLIPMIQQGIDAEGTDASSEMLAGCANKCRDKNVKPVLYYQKIQDLKLFRKYGMVFIPSGSFGLITDENEVNESLKRIHECLLPEGKFIAEIQTPYFPEKEEVISKREAVRNRFSKIVLTSKTRYDKDNNIETTDYLYESYINGLPDASESETINVKHYSKSEFEKLLKSAGFKGIEALKPYTLQEAGNTEEMILFRCRA